MRWALALGLLAHGALAIPPGIVGAGAGVTPPPTGYSWPGAWTFSVVGPRTTFDPTTLRPSGKAYYVSTTGSDAAAGTEAAPLRSVHVAAAKADVVEIHIAAGEYGYGNAGTAPHGGFGGVSKTVLVKRWGAGSAILSTRLQDLVWTEDAGAWKVAVTGTVGSVWDSLAPDADGMPVRLTLAADAAAVRATAGTYYKDGGGVLWVHTADSREPDAQIAAYRIDDSWESGTAATAWTQYFEDIDFAGGGPNIKGAGITFVMVRCTARYSRAGIDGVRIQSAAAAYLVDVTAEANGNDGVKANSSSGATPLLMERVTARYNGWGDTTVGNGYSRHTGGVTLGVNCTFSGNYGPNMHDIGTSETWLVYCNASDSRGTSGRSVNYAMSWGGSTGASKLWLYRCTSGPGASVAGIATNSPGTIVYRGLYGDTTTNGTGTFGTY